VGDLLREAMGFISVLGRKGVLSFIPTIESVKVPEG
jgi:hypothetical protein